MEKAVSVKNSTTTKSVLFVLAGSCFLALMARLSIYLPISPVPFTGQTLGVFLLAILQGKRLATYSVLVYLAQATMGLPVLAGGEANPLWFMSLRCGYLLGFPLAAYVSGTFLERGRSLIAFAAGQAVIYTLGVSWLSIYFGLQKAVVVGLVPYLTVASLKVVLAAGAHKLKARFS